MGANQHSL